MATGIVAVGDAAACTNPSLGRGISIAALQLASLRRAVRDVGTSDAEGLTMAFEARRAAEVDPYLGDTLHTSAHRLAQLEAHAAGVAYEPDDPGLADRRQAPGRGADRSRAAARPRSMSVGCSRAVRT